MQIQVLGAGINGLITAYFLSQEGAEVTVIERNNAPALDTSFANGGQQALSNCLPLASPALPSSILGNFIRRKEMRTLTLEPSLSICQLEWCARVLWNCRRQRFLRNVKTLARLWRHSKELMREFCAREKGIAFNLSHRGVLRFFRTSTDFKNFMQTAKCLVKEGKVSFEELSVQDIINRCPLLRGSARKDIYAGLLFPADTSADMYQFCCTLHDLCRQKGVTFHFDEEIKSIRSNKQFCKVHTSRQIRYSAHVVCCLGNESQRLLAPIGIKLLIAPVLGYSLTFPFTCASMLGKMLGFSMHDHRMGILATPLGSRLRVAGINRMGANMVEVETQSYVLRLHTWARELFTDLGVEYPGTWSSQRPTTPSGIPYYGSSKIPRIWLNTGHGGLGWTVSLATAKIVVRAIFEMNSTLATP